MAGTLTLAEAAKGFDKYTFPVANTLIEESQPMKLIPWKTTGELFASIRRWQGLPTVGRRTINAAFSASTGTSTIEEYPN